MTKKRKKNNYLMDQTGDFEMFDKDGNKLTKEKVDADREKKIQSIMKHATDEINK